jgi:hypothetical protein
MSQEQPPKILSDFEQAMKNLLGDNAEDIELLKDIPNIQHALVQHEIQRLDRKLGKDHPRVKNLRSNLARNSDVVRSFSPDVEKDPDDTPVEPSDDSIIMGRLVDEKNIAMAGMTVDIEDESGRKIPNLGSVRTDAAGNFILRIDPQNAEKVKNRVGGTGYLTVRDHKGKVVHQDAAPLRPDKGGHMSMNVSVSTEKFSGKEQVLKPRGAIRRPPMETGFGKGVGGLGTAALDGKGDDVTARLDGKGDNGMAAKGIGLTGPGEMTGEMPPIFSTDPGRLVKGEKPAEFQEGKGRGNLGLGRVGMDESEEGDYGEDVVMGKGKGNLGLGRVGMDESEEGDYGEDVVMGKGKGAGFGGSQRMDDEDDGEEIVAGRGMAEMGEARNMPPEGPPGPEPEDLSKKSEKKGFFRRGKEAPPPEEDPIGPMAAKEGSKVETKKLSRKERKQIGKEK